MRHFYGLDRAVFHSLAVLAVHTSYPCFRCRWRKLQQFVVSSGLLLSFSFFVFVLPLQLSTDFSWHWPRAQPCQRAHSLTLCDGCAGHTCPLLLSGRHETSSVFLRLACTTFRRRICPSQSTLCRLKGTSSLPLPPSLTRFISHDMSH